MIRGNSRFVLPPKDMIIKPWDTLKVRCDLEKLKEMRKNLMGYDESPVLIGGEDFQSSGTSIVELMVPADSGMENRTLKEIDFRRNYRGVPLAIRHREAVVHTNIEESNLKGEMSSLQK